LTKSPEEAGYRNRQKKRKMKKKERRMGIKRRNMRRRVNKPCNG
jgi:hypothetical protein